MKEFNPDEIWYVVDKRQGMYFEQCFRAAYTSGLVKQDTKLEFYGFGTMNGKDGKPFKMSKRAGTSVLMSDILAEIGSDALRFIFISKAGNSSLEFDIEKNL